MGLFGGGGKLSKATHKTTQIGKDIWSHGGREGLITAGLVAGAVLTGGAVAGIAGAAEGVSLGAAATAGAAGMAGTATTAGLLAGAAGAYQGAKATSARQDVAEAQYAYDIEASKAQEKERQNRRANLLSLRKNLTPSLSKTSQGGQASADSDIKSTGGIILG